MKAAILERVGEMDVTDVERPEATLGGLVVELGVCGICRTDAKMYRGGHRDLQFPRILGHEVAGTIAEIGKSVEGYEVGMRVQVAPGLACGACQYCLTGAPNMCDHMRIFGFHLDGGFAEYMAVPADAVRSGCVNPLPDGLSFEYASLAEPLACCINGQRLTRVGMDDVVAIIGSGPIGILHAQLAHSLGAKSVILIEKDARRLRNAGHIAKADMYVDASSEEPVDAVTAATDGRGADVVIIACSDAHAQLQGVKMLAKRGRMSMFSGLPAETPTIALDSNKIHYKEAQIVGAYGCTSLQNRQAVSLLASGRVDMSKLVTHRFKLDNVLDGLDVIKFRKGLKAVIDRW